MSGEPPGSESERPDGALPNLIVIGAQKCGTGAVHYYLGLHPEVEMSKPKELDFFVDEPAGEVLDFGASTRGTVLPRTRWRGNWSKGLQWYMRHFSPTTPVRGESSPNYTSPSLPGAAERMAAVVPEARLLFMVRDPIDRAVSEYMHRRAFGREQRDIDAALDDVNSRYVERSRYYTALEPFRRHFPAERILVVAQEDLRRDRVHTMASIYRFLEVDDSFRSAKFLRERNVSEARGRRHRMIRRLERLGPLRLGYRLPEDVKWAIERAATQRNVERPALDPAVRGRVTDRIKSEVMRLREVTQQDFADWSL